MPTMPTMAPRGPSRFAAGLVLLVGLLVPFMGFAAFHIGTYGVQFGVIAATAVVGLALYYWLSGLSRSWSPSVAWAAWLLVVVALISSVTTYYQPETDLWQFLKTFAHLGFYLAVFLALPMLRLDSRQIIWILRGLLLMAIPLCAYGIYQLPARLFDWPLAYLPFNNRSFEEAVVDSKILELYVRPSSVFLEPSHFGIYVVDMLILYGVTAVSHPTMLLRSAFMRLLFVLASTLGLAVTFSLGALVDLAFALLLGLWLIPFEGKRLLILKGAAALGVGLLILDLAMRQMLGFGPLELVSTRVGGIAEHVILGGDAAAGESLGTRLSSILFALRLWLEAPILGVGLGNLRFHAAREDRFGFVDSALVSTLAEMGVLAVVALILLLRPVFMSLKATFSPGAPTDLEAAGRAVFLIAAMHVFELIFQLGSFLHLGIWYWFGLAALVGVTYQLRWRGR